MASLVAEVVLALSRTRFPLTDEKRLQAAISDAFTAAGIEHQREFRLSEKDVIDFMLPGGLGIECKLKTPKMAAFRQLERYAQHEAVASILLVSNTPMGLPPEIAGKPAYFHSLAMAWL